MKIDFRNLMDSKEFIRFLFDKINTAVFILDHDLKMVQVNDAFKIIFSKDETDVLAKRCGNALGCMFAIDENAECGTTDKCDSCTIRSCLVGTLAAKGEYKQVYISREFYINDEKVLKHFQITVKQVQYQNEPMLAVIVDDITQLENQKNELRDMANKDYLTRLYNRRYFYEAGEQLFEAALRSGTPVTVAMIDLDHFKQVNDKYGHDAGDLVLKNMAALFKRSIRKSDIVARFGGEEFCILLTNCTGQAAFRLMEKMRKEAEAIRNIHGSNIFTVTFSCGLYCGIDPYLDDMIKEADLLLYKAKELGRNRIEYSCDLEDLMN